MEKIASKSFRSIKLCEKTQFQIEMVRFFKEQGIELKSQSENYIETTIKCMRKIVKLFPFR